MDANRHYMPDRSLFTLFKEIDLIAIHVTNGLIIHAHRCGDLKLAIPNEN